MYQVNNQSVSGFLVVHVGWFLHVFLGIALLCLLLDPAFPTLLFKHIYWVSSIEKVRDMVSFLLQAVSTWAKKLMSLKIGDSYRF